MASTPGPLRILAIANSPASEPCTFARVITPLNALQREGRVEYGFAHLMPWNVAATRHIVRHMRDWDLVWLTRPQQYVVLPIIRAARRQGKPVLVDIDDWLLDIPADHPHAAFFRPRPRQEIIRTALRSADAITTSTPVIAEHCKRLGLRVHVLPNAVDCAQFVRQPCSDRDVLTLAFCGTMSHHADVSLIAPALRQALHTHEGRVRVVSVGCPIPDVQGLADYTHHDFVPATDYPRLLSDLRVDIGLAPLHDTPFDRAKSDIKYLEYSAVGATTIASDVTPYQASIRDDRGVLVTPNTPEEWTAVILRMIEDTRLRQRLATSAYEWVRRERSIEATASRWHTIFRDYADGRISSPAPGTRQLDSGYYERVLFNIMLRQLPYNAQQMHHVVTQKLRPLLSPLDDLTRP